MSVLSTTEEAPWKAGLRSARANIVPGIVLQCFALAIVLGLTANHDVALVNSINPYRIAGQKTAAWEIVDTLGSAPNVHALPVGNAGNITAYWIGYSESAGEPTQALKVDPGMRQYATRKIASRLSMEKPSRFPICRVNHSAPWRDLRSESKSNCF